MIATPDVKQPRLMTPEEFLEWEFHQEGRYEYVDGRIAKMAGESPEHNEISSNMLFEIKGAFRGRPCKVYMAEVRVRVAETRYRYPDIVALCETPKFADTRPKTLLNPQVVIEVLSHSTQHIDLSEKMNEYFAMDSVTDYILVAQNRLWVERYNRRGPDQWNIRAYNKAEDSLVIEAIGVTLTLTDIYRDIVFDAAETLVPDDPSAPTKA